MTLGKLSHFKLSNFFCSFFVCFFLCLRLRFLIRKMGMTFWLHIAIVKDTWIIFLNNEPRQKPARNPLLNIFMELVLISAFITVSSFFCLCYRFFDYSLNSVTYPHLYPQITLSYPKYSNKNSRYILLDIYLWFARYFSQYFANYLHFSQNAYKVIPAVTFILTERCYGRFPLSQSLINSNVWILNLGIQVQTLALTTTPSC